MVAKTAADGLTDKEMRAMLDRSIKLATENKINKDNAWDWDLSGLMPGLIKCESAEPNEFNFQRASCGLDAGVKIYCRRVDSTYETAFQSMQGIVGVKVPVPLDGDDDGEGGSQAAAGAAEGGTQRSKRAAAGVKETQPESTLEEAENLREARSVSTFETDPLFRRTTKLFDENCPSGLLMLNFPVYQRSQILFDSEEVALDHFPKGRDQLAGGRDRKVDLSALGPLVQGLLGSAGGARITPSITSLHPPSVAVQAQQEVDLGGLLAAWAPDAAAAGAHAQPAAGAGLGSPGQPAFAAADVADGGAGDAEGEQGGGFDNVDDEYAHLGGGGGGDGFDAFAGGMGDDDGDGGLGDYGYGDDAGEAQHDGGVGGGAGGLADSLFDFTSMRRALAGPASSLTTHATSGGAAFWKYRPKPAAAANRSAADKAKPARRRKEAAPLSFDTELEISEEMLAQGSRAQLCLKRGSTTSKTLAAAQEAPYQVQQLFQLSLNPSVDTVKLWQSHMAAAAKQAAVGRGPAPAASAQGSWQDEGQAYGGGMDDDGADDMGGDVGGYDGGDGWQEGGAGDGQGAAAAADPLSLSQLLLPAPRKVTRVEVNYDKSAKQVDVRALKEAMRDSMSDLVPSAPPAAQGKLQGKALGFQQVMTALKSPSPDISVHLCFICLLHLANETGLALGNQGQLDKLDVLVPGA